MQRRLFNFTVATSLLLCFAIVTLWVRSYWVYEHVWLSRTRGINYSGILRSGSIIVSRSALTGRTTDMFSDDLDRGPGWSIRSDPAPRPAVSPFTAEGSPRWVQWIGFDSLARDTSRPGFGTLRFRRIIVPMWLPVLMTGLPAIPLVRRIRREKRRREGRCIRCG
jgi:hypothetical protein